MVQLTDESGKAIKTYEYDSFGNEVKPDGKDDNPFRCSFPRQMVRVPLLMGLVG